MIKNSRTNVRTPTEKEDNTFTLNLFYSRKAVGNKAGYKLEDWQIR